MCYTIDYAKQKQQQRSNNANKRINMINMIGTNPLKRRNSEVSSCSTTASSASSSSSTAVASIISKKMKLSTSIYLENQQQQQKQQQQQQQQQQQRKVVHFSLEDNIIIEYLPLCCETSQEEINNKWISKIELLHYQRVANEDAMYIQLHEQQQHQQHNNLIPLFSQAYANMHSLCHNSNNKDCMNQEEHNDSSLPCSVAIMEFLLSSCYINNDNNINTRGIEDRIILNIGIQRRLIRKNLIQTICSSSRLLNQNNNCFNQKEYNENTLLLCHISQSLSSPARQLSQYIGIIDSVTIAII